MPIVDRASKYYTESVSLTTTADTDVYTVPANFSSHVEHFFISNNDSSNIDYTLKFYHSDDDTTHTILDNHAVAGKGMESVFTVDKPLYLHTGDKLIVAAGTANELVATISVEEFFDPNKT
jgi:hypothetical protein